MTREEILNIAKQTSNILKSVDGMQDVVNVIDILSLTVKEAQPTIEAQEIMLADMRKRIEELEKNVDNAISYLEDCGWYSHNDKEQALDAIYEIKG